MNFLEVLQHLTKDGVEFVIVGGVAARLHGSSRLTHDLDIVPNLEEESWKKLISSIWELDTRPRIPESKERISDVSNIRQWITEKHMLALSFRSPSGRVEIDLLVSESDNFETLKENAHQIVYAGQTIHIASIDDLIEMKQRAGRPQDILDIETLQEIKNAKDTK